jgi:hypothetical protein
MEVIASRAARLNENCPGLCIAAPWFRDGDPAALHAMIFSSNVTYVILRMPVHSSVSLACRFRRRENLLVIREGRL